MLTAVLFHMMLNSSLLFPDYFDPVVVALAAVVVAAVVALLWGPRTLAHFRYPRTLNRRTARM